MITDTNIFQKQYIMRSSIGAVFIVNLYLHLFIVHLHRCQIYRLRVFENSVLKRIFGLKRDEEYRRLEKTV
jgi:membrane protein YdbS with pleckstrin-like domain